MTIVVRVNLKKGVPKSNTYTFTIVFGFEMLPKFAFSKIVVLDGAFLFLNGFSFFKISFFGTSRVDVDLLLDSFLPPPNSKTIYGSCSKFLKSKTNPSHVTCSLFNSLIGNLVPSTTFVKCEIVGKSSSNFC